MDFHRFFHEYPLCLFLIALLAWRRLPIGSLRFWRAASIVAGAVVLALGIAYAVAPVIAETGESQIAAVSYLAGHGAPLYPAIDSVARYGELYGPGYYLLVAAFLRIFGTNLIAAKLPGLLLLGLTLFAVSKTARDYVVLGAVALLIARFGVVGFWIHPDPAVLACVAVAAWAVAERKDPAIVVGFCLGAAVDFKISAVAYFLPILALLEHRWRAILIACAVAGAPFLLPQVSLGSYLATIQTVARQPFDVAGFWGNVQYAVIFALPALLWARFGLFSISIAIGMIGCCVAGSKPGAGPHHLLPMAPVLALCFLRFPRPAWFSRVTVPWAVTVGLYSLSTLLGPSGYIALFRDIPQGRETAPELDAILADYRGQRIEMGYGESIYTRATMFRPLLVFAGQPYTLDVASLMDMQLGGVGIPAVTREYLRSCGTRVWLIPRNERPFEAVSWFDNARIFDDDFRNTFLERYEKRESRHIFDVWVCGA